MDFYEAVERRRHVRKFKAPATEEQLRRIIIAGTKAPSPDNDQTWEFVVVDDPALIEQIGEIKYQLNLHKAPLKGEYETRRESRPEAQKASFANASLVVVFCRAGIHHLCGTWTCIQNMLLAAAVEGLQGRVANYWGEAERKVKRLLGVPRTFKMATAISIGVPGEEPPVKKFRPEGSWLHRNRF